MANSDDLQRILARPGYRVTSSVGRLQSSESQSLLGQEFVGIHGGEKASAECAEVVTRKPRYRVEITLYRTRLIDADNAFVKPLIDQLRYHQIIPNDDPQSIELVVRQNKVAKVKFEGTGVCVTKIN